MKTVKIVRQTTARVEGHIGLGVLPNEIHTVDDDQAAVLIAAGDAVEVKASPSPAAARRPVVIEQKTENPAKRGKR